jgi:hypothetical protein
MSKVPLSKSNPYLREAADLKAALLTSVITSTAIATTWKTLLLFDTLNALRDFPSP